MPLCIFCRFFRGDSTNIPLTSKSVVLYCGIFVVDLLCGCSCTLRKSQIYSQPFRYLMDFKFQCRWWWCTCKSLHSVHTASQPLLYSRFFFILLIYSVHFSVLFVCFIAWVPFYPMILTCVRRSIKVKSLHSLFYYATQHAYEWHEFNY